MPSELSARQWARVREHCDAHMGDDIDLETLAALCDTSRFHFIRRFKATSGMTPHAWLLRRRLERARVSLLDPRQSITAVSADMGFYDQSHFARMFRRAYGIAPTAYRKLALSCAESRDIS
jgi:AraC-like DNA-binding protein